MRHHGCDRSSVQREQPDFFRERPLNNHLARHRQHCGQLCLRFAACDFRYSKTLVLAQLAFVYTEIVRNLPLILILYFAFFELPEFGLQLSIFWKMAIGLILFEISQLAEIVRGGLNSIEKGQIEAARSTGMTYRQTLFHIIIPQAFKRMIPALVSQFITIVKDTSYTAMFGLMDVLNAAQIIWTSSSALSSRSSSWSPSSILSSISRCPASACGSKRSWDKRKGGSPKADGEPLF